MQHAFQSLDAGDADRAGRKPGVFIRIVRAVVFQVLVEDAAQAECLKPELYGRVGLQEHAAVKAVDVKACYDGFFSLVCRFFFYDGCQCADFVRG